VSVESGVTDRFALIPKAEIHLHLEGSVDLDTLLVLRSRRGDPAGPEARRGLSRLYRHGDFRTFLGNYRDLCAEIGCPDDFGVITDALSRRLQQDNVRYAEVMCSPMIFTRRGFPLDEIMEAIAGAARRREGEGGPTLRFLFDGVRQWGAGALEELVLMAAASRAQGVIGIGIGGDETACPARDLAASFREARRLGLRATAHAGEFDGPRSVWEAIDMLEVDRVGHGIRAVEDPELLSVLARRRVPLECCPSSNLATGVVRSSGAHPIVTLVAAGVRVTVNSDDPALFGTTLSAEWGLLAGRLGLGDAGAYEVGRTTVECSFLEEAPKQLLLDEMSRAAALSGIGR
jgi:aminodeoxyfutalosine deaminase